MRLITLIFISVGITVWGQKADTTKGSLPKFAEIKVGEASFKISYYAPAVRGRIVYGGVVPFDQVWVTGAHSATSLEFDKPVTIGDKKLSPGKYAFFTIPGRESWTIIINKNWDQHLTDDYDATLDLVRLSVTPMAANHRERLMYRMGKVSDKEINFVFHWEKVLIQFPIKIE